jgi:hypothetical protein
MNLLKEICEPMGRSDLIALLSACFAALAAIYARWSAKQARISNEITIQSELKPRRESVYASLRDFLQFCSAYKTMQHLKMVQGTNDLMNKIDIFKWEVEKHGPLDMPDVEQLIEDSMKTAWQLQRLLDRLTGPNPQPLDKGFETAEDNLDSVIDWFGAKKKELKDMFEPYLRITQQRH